METTSQACVFVTGGTSGIGLATVKAFLSTGAKVAINYLSDDTAAQSVIRNLQNTAGAERILAAPGDITDHANIKEIVTLATRNFGGLDVLVNNAGISGTSNPIPMSELDRMTDEFWAKIMTTNLMGPFWCSRACSAILRPGGSIINVASIAGLGKGGSSMAYAASKAALINMTINLARALAPNLRVNAVAPGLTKTAWTESWSPRRIQQSLATTALNRWVMPEDVAQSILFLATNRAITGQTIVIDAGRL